MTGMWRKFRKFLIFRVLHADDPPHNIALGLAIGILVAMTPTIGIQMVLAAAIAASFRANKIVSMAAVWISNPVTMISIYFFNWRVGQHIIQTSMVNGQSEVRSQIGRIAESIGGVSNLFFHLFDKVFWSEVLSLVWALGIELCIGSFIVGAAFALPSYVVLRFVLTVYRRRVPRPRGLFLRALRKPADGKTLAKAKPQLRRKSRANASSPASG